MGFNSSFKGLMTDDVMNCPSRAATHCCDWSDRAEL